LRKACRIGGSVLCGLDYTGSVSSIGCGGVTEAASSSAVDVYDGAVFLTTRNGTSNLTTLPAARLDNQVHTNRHFGGTLQCLDTSTGYQHYHTEISRRSAARIGTRTRSLPATALLS